MEMSQNRFSESNEIELEATRKLLTLTRERLAAAIFTITELETLLEMSKMSPEIGDNTPEGRQ